MRRLKWLANWMACAGLALLYGVAQANTAADNLLQGLQVGGFGSISAYRGDDAGVAVRPGERVKSASRNGQWRADGDSVLGAQARWQMQEQLEWVWQVQLRDDLVGGVKPRTEWAYLGWRPSNPWSLRLGRQPLPIYLNSEISRVGFAQTTVRPMSSVYGLSGNEPVDGLNVSHSSEALGGTLTVDLGAGKNSVTLPRGRVDTEALLAGAIRWHKEGLSLRLGMAAYRFDLMDPVLQAQLESLQQSGSPCSNCASVLPDRARTQGVQGRLINLGLVWESGDWTLMAEATRRGGNSIFSAEVKAWYALLSRRFGALTPYISLGNTDFSERQLGLQAAPGSSAGSAQALALLDRSLQRPWDRRIEMAGLRWDWAESAALKLQYERWTATQDRCTPRSGEVQLTPDMPPWDGQVNLITVSLDFVF